MDIGILIFDGVEELDFVGPYEVFTMSNEVFSRQKKENADTVRLIAAQKRNVRCAKGMHVVADVVAGEVDALDVLVVPGGEGTRPLLKDQPMLDWIKRISDASQWTTSVCTGSFLLAASGVADNKKVTTHWALVDEMKSCDWPVKIVTGARFVRDGDLVTAAGVSAGIDMALWLVGQWHGRDHARWTQKAMEYDPAPPYTADV